MTNRKISAFSDIGPSPSGYIQLPVVDRYEAADSDKNKLVTVSGLDTRYAGYPYFQTNRLTPVTTTTTAGTTLDVFASGFLDSARYHIKAKRGREIQTSEVHLVQNGSTTVITEYAVLYTSGILCTYSGTFANNSGVLQTFSNTAASTRYTIIRYGDTPA